MANLCDFEMLVRGESEDIKSFFNSLTHRGNIWMGRGADARLSLDEEDNSAIISGYCKWSIQSALIKNAISMKNAPEKWAGLVPGNEYLTLPECCNKWSLNAEIFSEELGCEFQEHYIINSDGKMSVDEECKCSEHYISQYSTKTEAEKELRTTITDEEWKNNDYIVRGGYKWDYSI